MKTGAMSSEFWFGAGGAMAVGTIGLESNMWQVAAASAVGLSAIVMMYLWSRTKVKQNGGSK